MAESKLSIIADLKMLNREMRLPVLYVTHSREEAVALGERVVVYERGRVAAVGEPLEVFAAPRTSGVARLTGVENLFNARVVSRDEAAGTMTVVVVENAGAGAGACRLTVPLGDQAVGDVVTVAVRSGDVLLAAEEPRRTSARNILRGRVESVEEEHARVLARVVCGGVAWAVSLTRQSVKELNVEAGREVWLAVKTHSCHLLDARG